MELGPFYLHALFYLGRVGNRIKPNWMALQFHFRRILLAVIAAIVLECDAIWLQLPPEHVTEERLFDQSPDRKSKLLWNKIQIFYIYPAASTLGHIPGNFLHWTAVPRCLQNPFFFSFLILLILCEICLFIYLLVCFYSLQVLFAVNEFNGFFLKTSFMDAKQKYVCLHFAVFII